MIFNRINPVYTLPLKNKAAVPELTAIGSERRKSESQFDLTACSIWGDRMKKSLCKETFYFTPEDHFPRKSRMS